MGKYSDLVKHGHAHGPGGTDPIPGLTSQILAGATLPFPPVMPHAAVCSYQGETRKWPGGVIVIPCYAYNGAATVGAADSGIFAWKSLTDAQTAASFAGAATTCSIPVETAGIPLGQEFWVFVQARATGTATNPRVRIGPKPSDGNAADSGYGVITPIVQTYMGLKRATYTNDIGGSAAYKRSFTAGETITVKAYADSGSGSIILDNLILIPAGNQPGTSAAATYVGSFNFDRGPTVEDSTDDSVQAYSSNSILLERQIRGGDDDPLLTFTVKGDEPDAAYVASQHNLTYATEMYYPRHKYVLARIVGAGGAYDGQAGFIVNKSGGVREGYGTVNYQDWGLVYLGLVPGVRVWGDQSMTAWLASISDGDYSWGEFYDEGTEALALALTLYPSSRYDWDGFNGAAGFAYIA